MTEERFMNRSFVYKVGQPGSRGVVCKMDLQYDGNFGFVREIGDCQVPVGTADYKKVASPARLDDEKIAAMTGEIKPSY